MSGSSPGASTGSSLPELEVEYPTTWTYKVIGSSSERLEQAIREVVGERSHALQPSRESSSGKYLSYTLDVRVEDEVERKSLFEALRNQSAVRLVL